MNPEDRKSSEQVEKYEFPEGSFSNFGEKKYLILSLVTLAIIVIVSVIFVVYAEQNSKAGIPVKDAVGWDVLRIDGNRNGIYVDFDHEAHKDILGSNKNGCKKCHHLSKPNDRPSSCYQCHSYMETPASIFDHDYHSKLFTEKKSCKQCHTNNEKQSTSKCSACHEEYTEDNKFYLSVRSYKDAMHTQCTVCHKADGEKTREKMLKECTVCHSNKL